VGVSLGLALGKWAGLVDGVGRENQPGTGFEIEIFRTFISFSILHCDQEIDSKAKTKIWIARSSGIFSEKMGKDNAFTSVFEE